MSTVTNAFAALAFGEDPVDSAPIRAPLKPIKPMDNANILGKLRAL
jgi:hypothetical protein